MSYNLYIATIHNPLNGETVEHMVRAVSDNHAEREAKDGYAGLLGNEDVWDQLEVTVQQIP